MGARSNALVRSVRTKRDRRRDEKRALAESMAREMGVVEGQLWVVTGTAGIEHTVYCGDGSSFDAPVDSTVVVDPPWDRMPSNVHATTGGALVFTDGAHIGDALRLCGPNVAWQFVWDCGSCFVQGQKPIQRFKSCLWYGDVRTFRSHRADVPTALRPDGTKLADLYVESLTLLLTESLHPHAKPLLWVTHIVGRCAGDVVVDQYLGSGTTLLACDATGKRCIGAEIEPAWVAVALRRAIDAGMSVRCVR